jgi:hypothetical protein
MSLELIFGAFTSYFSENNDLMAEDAVRYEPFSAGNSLLTGKNTGNFV